MDSDSPIQAKVARRADGCVRRVGAGARIRIGAWTEERAGVRVEASRADMQLAQCARSGSSSRPKAARGHHQGSLRYQTSEQLERYGATRMTHVRKQDTAHRMRRL